MVTITAVDVEPGHGYVVDGVRVPPPGRTFEVTYPGQDPTTPMRTTRDGSVEGPVTAEQVQERLRGMLNRNGKRAGIVEVPAA